METLTSASHYPDFSRWGKILMDPIPKPYLSDYDLFQMARDIMVIRSSLNPKDPLENPVVLYNRKGGQARFIYRVPEQTDTELIGVNIDTSTLKTHIQLTHDHKNTKDPYSASEYTRIGFTSLPQAPEISMLCCLPTEKRRCIALNLWGLFWDTFQQERDNLAWAYVQEIESLDPNAPEEDTFYSEGFGKSIVVWPPPERTLRH